MKIIVDKVKNYEFEGHVKTSDLSDDQLKVLGIDRNNYADVVQVIGAFSAWASQDDAEINGIEYVTLLGTETGTSHNGPTGKFEKWRDDYGMLNVKEIWAEIKDVFMLELEESQYDSDDLCDQLLSQSDTYEWYQDRLEYAADMAYESMRDGD